MNLRHFAFVALLLSISPFAEGGPTLIGPAPAGSLSTISLASAGTPNFAGTRLTFQLADATELDVTNLTLLNGFGAGTQLSSPSIAIDAADTTIPDTGFSLDNPDLSSPLQFTVWHPQAGSSGGSIPLSSPVTIATVTVEHKDNGTGAAGNGDVDFSVTIQNFFSVGPLLDGETVNFDPAQVVEINEGTVLSETWSPFGPADSVTGPRGQAFMAVTPSTSEFGIQQVPEPSAVLFCSAACFLVGLRRWVWCRRVLLN